MATTLEGSAATNVISNLGKLAKGIECLFSCGGTVRTADSIFILYKTQTGDWSSKPLKLPLDDTAQDIPVKDLLNSCSTASFGFGDQTVTDKSYRDALKLEPDCFTTNFKLSSTSVLNHISTLMTIASPIRAELYKLNTYSTGGHFKSHVDTPRSKGMFGSLVICLPSHFTGGELVARHQGRKVTFDWSTCSNSDIQWAAFFSNVEHEVLPVTSGHRITLTYNLYYSDPLQGPASSYDVTTNPLYQELVAALHTPHFMRGGGILGFYCQHKYTNTVEFNDVDKCAPLLKGEDAVIYNIAKSMGLPIALKPVCDSGGDNQYVMKRFQEFCERKCCSEDEEDLEILHDTFCVPISNDDKITWCQGTAIREPAGVTPYYGNAASCTVYYQSVSLLILIPKFTTKRSEIGSTPLAIDKDSRSSKAVDTALFPPSVNRKKLKELVAREEDAEARMKDAGAKLYATANREDADANDEERERDLEALSEALSAATLEVNKLKKEIYFLQGHYESDDWMTAD